MNVTWSPARQPLPIAGVFAEGEPARLLATRLPADATGVVTADGLVALGTELPWVDGVIWLTRAAPGLYHDTRLQPSVPASWMAAAVRTRGAVLWLPNRLIPLVNAAPFDPTKLAVWAG